MRFAATKPKLRDSVLRFAKQLLCDHQRQIYRRTDRMFVDLMLLQWLGGVALALWISPTAWAGTESHTHPHVWSALFLGGAITFFPVLLGSLRPGATSTRHVIAIGQMLMGGLLIHLSGGRIETHFHVFVSLGILAFYRDWRVFVPATLVVAADHFLRGLFWPQSVYGVLHASNFRTLEHAAWVIFADIFLVVSCLRAQRDMWNKATEHASLKATEKDFRQLADAMPQIVWTANPDGWLDYYNQQWFDYTAMTLEQAEGWGWKPVVHPDDLDQCLGLWSNAVQTGEKYEVKYRFKRASDGAYRWHLGRASAVRDEEGRIVKWFGTCTDIDDQKRAEEALEIARNELELRVAKRTTELARTNNALQAEIFEREKTEVDLKEARNAALESARLKSEFLANMSHEIRTPMNGVVGMTGLLLDTELDANQREFAETIRSSGDALLTIINDILDFSKIEAGKLEFETVDFDLRNAVEETIELLAEKARARQLEFASLIYEDVPTSLRGDPGRLRQVLMNLVGNALKFTEQGEVIVRAEKEYENATEVMIRFTINDTGIGISSDVQARLFQAFTQADGSTKRKYGGTGLGLSISKQLVELMGGQVGVRSTPGEGSTFWFTAKLEKQIKTATLPQSPSGNLEKLRVLIVDDNATNRKILSHQLGSWGMIHSEAESGAQALELLKTAAAGGVGYDLAILDLFMPNMDGLELAGAIKSDPSIAGVCLVLLTSSGVRGDGTNAQAAGVAAYLTKPVRQSQLFHALTMVMSTTTNSPAFVTPTFVSRHTLRDARPVSNKLILLAEDNIVNQKVAVRQLEKLGYRADAVANGREAIEALSRIPYDLVLMDCQMPEMDGYEATAEIRRLEGTLKHTPIIAMTAHALDGDREKSIEAGMDDHITKPVKTEQLARVLGIFFGRPAEDLLRPKKTATEVTPPVDVERLQQAIGNCPEEISEIVELYCDQMTESLAKLATAIADNNAAEIELIAHNCAGTSGNCGMVAVVEQLHELERMGRENQLQDAAQYREQVVIQFERIKLFLSERFAPLATQ